MQILHVHQLAQLRRKRPSEAVFNEAHGPNTPARRATTIVAVVVDAVVVSFFVAAGNAVPLVDVLGVVHPVRPGEPLRFPSRG